MQDGKDREFLVVMSDPFTELVKAEFVESGTSNESRELEITFKKGNNLIEITGTNMVPEFPFSIVIASVAIGVMIAIMRFRKLSKIVSDILNSDT